MAHPRFRAPLTLLLALFLGVACKDAPTIVTPPAERTIPTKLMTAEDSAAFIGALPAASGRVTATGTIDLQAGDRITVLVTSNECSGNPETVNVTGAISSVVASGSCAGGLVGQGGTFGPATADGTIYFTATHPIFGTGPGGAVTGSFPNYTVGLNDGYGDSDFNDVVLSVRVVRSSPSLNCTPTPTRGDDVSCEVTGDGIAVTTWSFTGPSYNGSTTHNFTEESSVNPWKGTAVASGTVTAEITVNGVRRDPALTDDFTVQTRTAKPDWDWESHWRYGKGEARDCAPNDDWYYLKPRTLLGWNVRKGGCDGNTINPVPSVDRTVGYTVSAVTSGPNAGLSYVTSLSYRMDTESNINSSIKAESPAVYQLVHKADKKACLSKDKQTAITAANFYTYNTACKKYNLEAGLFTGLYNHEGYGTSNNSGHQAQLEIAARKPDNNLYARAERLFAEGNQRTADAVVDLANDIAGDLNAVGQDHTNVMNNWSGWVWRWYPTSSVFYQYWAAF